MKFSDIPQFTADGNYRVNQSWQYLEEWIERHTNVPKSISSLDLEPDFQRAHVWTEQQQIKYVEFCLRGGRTCNELRFNCPGWMGKWNGPFVIVDGKQRLHAARQFLANKLPVFDGYYYSDFTDRLPYYCDFIIVINNLKTRKEVLQWYLDINTGGTVHTNQEIEKVKQLLEKENGNDC